MTRQRLLVQVRPVPETLPSGRYICARCGIESGMNKRRTHSGICPDCNYTQSGSNEAVAFGMLVDGYTLKEVCDALGMDKRRVGQIRKRAQA